MLSKMDRDAYLCAPVVHDDFAKRPPHGAYVVLSNNFDTMAT